MIHARLFLFPVDCSLFPLYYPLLFHQQPDKSVFTSLLPTKNLRLPILGEAEVFSYAIVWVFYQNSPLLSLRALAWVSSRRLNSSL